MDSLRHPHQRPPQALPLPPNQTPSHTQFFRIVVVSGASIICVMIIIYCLAKMSTRTFSQQQQQGAAEDRGMVSRRQELAGVLSKDFVQRLPLKKYAIIRASRESKRFRDCPVCLTEFRDNENIRILPICGHGFHSHCIQEWFSSHSNCPLCRKNLLAPPNAENSTAYRNRNPSSDTTSGGSGNRQSPYQGMDEAFTVDVPQWENDTASRAENATDIPRRNWRSLRRFASLEIPSQVRNWVIDLVQQVSTPSSNAGPSSSAQGSLEAQQLLNNPHPIVARSQRLHSWHHGRRARDASQSSSPFFL